ncbi:MAG: TlpA disulfide reductase family protein [Candidatus Zixiibacteriota bacterium]
MNTNVTKQIGHRIRQISILSIAASAVLLASCKTDNQKTGSTPGADLQAQPAMAAGQNQFKAYDLNGKLRNSSEWVGRQPVVLNFWGTWCPPCRREIPDLVKLYDEYRTKGVEIIGLAVKDQPMTVKVFTQEAGMDWVMLMADYDVLSQFNVTGGIPTTIFLDKNGNEIGRVIGAQSYEQFKPRFDAIL